jgi:hypothetical protein
MIVILVQKEHYFSEKKNQSLFQFSSNYVSLIQIQGVAKNLSPCFQKKKTYSFTFGPCANIHPSIYFCHPIYLLARSTILVKYLCLLFK